MLRLLGIPVMPEQGAALLGAVAIATGLASQALGAELKDLPNSWEGMPPGTVQKGDVPGQGRLWSDPAGGTSAPTYCVYRAKIICVIYHIAAVDLEAERSWLDLTPVEGGALVDHVDLTRDDTGLAISLYFLNDAQLKTIQPPYDYHY